MITKHVLPDGRSVHLVARHVIDANRPQRASFRPPAGLPPVTLPVDWSGNGSVDFPMLGNDQAGDCMYVAACHIDQAMTAAVGNEAKYDAGTVLSYYHRLSGGDNGLAEFQIVNEWDKGLCGNPDASILDSLDIDVTDDELVASAIYLFGGVQFILSCPSRWIGGFTSGCVWDAPAIPNPMAGHGTAWVGMDEQKRRRLLTWGGYCWITSAGVGCCNPSGFVVFSKRWFDPATGIAPNGMDYDTLARLWVKCGGKSLPPDPFKTAEPPA